jgi:hypothetical protein
MSAEKRTAMGTLGADAAARWLAALALTPVPRWFCEIGLAHDDARFELNIYPEEWGFAFHHKDRSSWIRVTDIAFVHGRDDFGLLAETPDLLAIAAVLARIESSHGVPFPRANADVKTNLENAAEPIRAWLARPAPKTPLRRTREL